jgi:PAT family beta-lactamase induction signal transducer AmpG
MTKYISVFANKRMLTTLLLGFSSGLPLALTSTTLQAWLTQSKIDVATIGRFALVGLPYALKFLWAPFMDSVMPPMLGLRRGWMILSQIGLFLSTVALGMLNPAQDLTALSLVALLVAFFSASQDIVIDAYRIEILNEDEMGAGAGTYITGYRIAMVVSGGIAFVMADHMSWMAVYIAMACVNLIGMATILFSPEPRIERKKANYNFKKMVVSPFLEFFERTGAMEILLFIMIYKISTLMATALTTRFLIGLGYSLTMIGTTNKFAGLIATIFGTLMGGSLMTRFGLKRSLWFFGILQSLVGLTYFFLSHLVVSAPEMKDLWLILIVCVDNFMMGLGTAALTGFMMNFANRQFTGTQYALLTSVMAVSRVILIAQAGVIVEKIGWDIFFIATVPLAIPGLLMLTRYDHWQTAASKLHVKIPPIEAAEIATFVTSLILLASGPIWSFLRAMTNAPEFETIGTWSTVIGAWGIVAVVAAGLIRPRLQAKLTS